MAAASAAFQLSPVAPRRGRNTVPAYSERRLEEEADRCPLPRWVPQVRPKPSVPRRAECAAASPGGGGGQPPAPARARPSRRPERSPPLPGAGQ